MKKIVAAVLMILMAVMFTACGTTSTESDNTTSQSVMTPTQAISYLDKIYVAGVEDVPNPSCGISLPDDMPMEYFEMKATAVSISDGKTVDLLEDREVKPGEWIVFDNLDKYSEAVCVMRIKFEDDIFEEKEVDLLDVQDDSINQ